MVKLMIAAVILAAGASSRMGRPKALLELGGMTFAERIAATLRDAAVDRIMIAVSHTGDKLLQLSGLAEVEPVVNAATPTAVPLGSIQSAVLAIINQKVDSLIVWPVDQPHVSVRTVRTIVSEFLASGKQIGLPLFDGRRGHPVVFGRPVFQELVEAPAAGGARTVVRADRNRVIEIPVSDSAVIEDVDTPEEYLDLLRRFPR